MSKAESLEQANAKTQNSQLHFLAGLLQLQQDIRHGLTTTDLAFLLVNETYRLIPYQQAVLCMKTAHAGVKVEAISSVNQLDSNALLVVWLRQTVKQLMLKSDAYQMHLIREEEFSDNVREGFNNWSSDNVLWCPLHDERGGLLGGLWVSRKLPYTDLEKLLLSHIADTFAHAWYAIARPKLKWTARIKNILSERKWQLGIVLLLAVLSIIPVRISVLAPAEVVASNTIVVSSPIDGVIKKFYVQPNQFVDEGTLLFSLDDTTTRNQYELAKKSLSVAKADYLRATQKSFTDDASKTELTLLRAQVDQKKSEVSYTEELLMRIQVHSMQAGVAIFADINDWIGKPVSTGQKVLMLAAPDQTELQAWIPVGDAVNLSQNSEVELFLNTNPLQPLQASLRQASYEAQQSPAGVLAFRIKARFDENTTVPRIGLKGTAKLYGEQVTLIYYLFRRPWAAIRQWVGW